MPWCGGTLKALYWVKGVRSQKDKYWAIPLLWGAEETQIPRGRQQMRAWLPSAWGRASLMIPWLMRTEFCLRWLHHLRDVIMATKTWAWKWKTVKIENFMSDVFFHNWKKKATHEISHIQIFNFLLTPPQIIKKENTTEVYETRNPHADIKHVLCFLKMDGTLSKLQNCL